MPEIDLGGEPQPDGVSWDRPSASLVEAEVAGRSAMALSASDCAVQLVPVAVPPE